VRYSVAIGDASYDIELIESEGRLRCRLNGRELALDFAAVNSNTASWWMESLTRSGANATGASGLGAIVSRHRSKTREHGRGVRAILLLRVDHKS
jgi:hypothetical protein